MNKFLENILEGNSDITPIITSQEEEENNKKEVPQSLPILTLRGSVLFPALVIPITAGRKKSIQLINDAYKNETPIVVVSQLIAEIEDPGFADIYEIGTMSKILRTFNMPDGSITAIIQGQRKVRITEELSSIPYLTGKVEPYEDKPMPKKTKKLEALVRSVKDIAINIIEKDPQLPNEASFALHNINSDRYLINYITSNTDTSLSFKQQQLEEKDFLVRTKRLFEVLVQEIQMLELKNQIHKKTKIDINKQQKDYFLNQQIKTIQEELGGSASEQDFKELESKAKKKKWNKETKELFSKELAKLRRMNPQAPDYSTQLNYLDFFVELPWNEFSTTSINLTKARNILEKDHYGLEEVKERIIEHLAVMKLKDDLKAPILCFVGPPGVGKTSLGKSVAEALGREYVRMSLGGLRDESELRGHRKTYIGAMPGRILKNIKKAGTSNPVFILDEIDKVMGANHSGDPQAALLEILDPEQNTSFHDNFLEADFDLSKVMFIATANTLSSIHPALIDRMEVIQISGYLQEEKTQIAKKHLIPKQLKEHGVEKKQLQFPKKIVENIIENYTREAGVRRLEKSIAKVIRKRVFSIVENKEYNVTLKPEDLKDTLGAPIYSRDKEINFNIPGVVTGLAWTKVGGEILFIEVSLSEGKGTLSLTGNLGDVMKESAKLAFAYLKANREKIGIDQDSFTTKDVHIHIPAGATPKDGPSAGITMLTALASAFTGRIVKKNLAMTGEITLRGKVLPVGGVKDKILAAKRVKVKEIILSKENKKDIEEIPEQYIKGITFHFVDTMMEVLELALLSS